MVNIQMMDKATGDAKTTCISGLDFSKSTIRTNSSASGFRV